METVPRRGTVRVIGHAPSDRSREIIGLGTARISKPYSPDELLSATERTPSPAMRCNEGPSIDATALIPKKRSAPGKTPLFGNCSGSIVFIQVYPQNPRLQTRGPKSFAML